MNDEEIEREYPAIRGFYEVDRPGVPYSDVGAGMEPGAPRQSGVEDDGVIDFLGRCRQGGHKVAIVSHKTQFAARDRGEVDLRQAALDWMQGQGFFSPAGLAIERHQVIFADSRRQKCQTIGALRCDLFIDDLPELFADSAFPADTRRILFHDAPPPIPCGRFEALGSWKEIADAIFRQS